MAKAGKGPQSKIGPASISNRRAGHDYEFLDTYEAGLVLQGSEVKSLYAGRANLTDAYVRLVNGEAWVLNLDIEPYGHTSAYRPERRRDRKLLLHKKEIELLKRKAEEKGLALIPTGIYFKNRRAKISVAIARGKKTYDKRETLKDKAQQRELDRELKGG